MQPSIQHLVREFHVACDLDAPARPAPVSPELAAHRQELLHEEVQELAEAAASGDLEHIAHELADVVYIAYGTAVVHGIDLDAVIREIHRANMSKLGPDGRPARRSDGKVLKGDAYQPPDVAAVLRAQGWAPGGHG
ncbi:pyrophosphohydrolase domain-containing protein [Streptomyces sp. NPDC055709]